MPSNARAAALATTARCSGDRSTPKRHACGLAPDGAHIAACRHRSNVASSTGWSVKRRIVRAVDIASQTSLVAPGMPAPFWLPSPAENLVRASKRRQHRGHRPQHARFAQRRELVVSPGRQLQLLFELFLYALHTVRMEER